MKLFSSLSFFARLLLAGVVISPVALVSPACAQGVGLDQQDFEKGMAATDAGKLQEAASYFEGIPTKYPTSPFIPQATVRLGYAYFRLLEYDKAVKTLQGLSTLKSAPPEILELAASLIPQVLSAKAAAGGPRDPQRKRLFEDAIKGYDAFIVKYPQSDEQESANYGKAVALYQIERFDEAQTTLRSVLKSFPQSETVLDSQFLLAMTMGTVANLGSVKQAKDENAKPDPAIQENYKNAELMLTGIVTVGRDVALANESRFQIAELRFARANFAKDEKARDTLLIGALETYRVVGSKEFVVNAQKARIERIRALRVPAMQQNNQPRVKQIARAIEREQEKLANIEARTDQTISARVKMGEVFFQLNKLDEARLVLNAVKPLVEDEEQKKAVTYQIILSLAKQNNDLRAAVAPLAERTETVYKEFKAAYGNDPIGENLPYLLGAAFLDGNKAKSKAYFEELGKDFPESPLVVQAGNLLSSILASEGNYEEAIKGYKEVLAKNPPPDVAVSAEFGMAVVYQNQKNPEAIAMYKKVRDTFPGTTQATEASLFFAQLTLESGDAKGAMPALQDFVKNNAKSKLMPNAYFFLGQAQESLDLKKEAIATYQRLAAEYPDDTVAPFTYFQRAKMLNNDKKTDETVQLMHQFMEKYPNSDALYQAYEFVAQIQTLTDKQPLEGIATYEKFIAAKPQDPMAAQALLLVGRQWKEQGITIGRYLMLDEAKRASWREAVDKSIDAAERLVRQHPDAPQVALALALVLDDLKLRVGAKLATAADVEPYLQKLADEFKEKPATRSKIIFTLAGTLMEKERNKALKLMAGVYDPQNKYAPEDTDLYGIGLIDEKKYDEAQKVFVKLATDYPLPANVELRNVPREIQDAQSMSLFGLGRILQEQGKGAEAKIKFDELEKDYGWSPKMVAANLGIADTLYDEKKFDEGLKRLSPIIRNGKAPAELRARAMLLLAKIYEGKKEYDDAINNYIKIADFYEGVPKIAAEGLWRGANLLEQQSRGELPIPTPVPRVPAGKKPAVAPKAPAGEAPAPAAPEPGATAAK